MQLMLGIYDFVGEAAGRAEYPKRFTIDSLRAYRPLA